MIPFTARNLHHIITLQRHVQNYFMRCLRAMHAFEIDPHDIKASDVPGSISKELTSF